MSKPWCALMLASVMMMAWGLAAAHGERPDFSGTWKLDMEKSEFGDLPGGKPNSRTDVIKQNGQFIRQVLYLNNGGQLDTTVYRYLTNGTENVNEVAGSKIKSTVWWEDTLLHLESRAKLLVFDMSLKEKWMLSSDGQTLTMERTVKSPLGDGDQVLVFEKLEEETVPAEEADEESSSEE